MSVKRNIADYLIWLLLALAAALMAGSFFLKDSPGDTAAAAVRSGRAVAARTAQLDLLAEKALSGEDILDELPPDMVIYRYLNDSLVSWNHQFPVRNDDISPRAGLHSLSRGGSPLISPLTAVEGQYSFLGFGPRWYLARRLEKDACTVIAGLEVCLGASGRAEEVNPRLHLSDKFSITPLSEAGGSPVMLQGRPLFKIQTDATGAGTAIPYSSLIWIALGLYLCGTIFFLARRRTLRNFLLVMAGLIFVTVSLYLWGRGLGEAVPLFSPTLYADGQMNSLGTLLLVNIAVFMTVLYVYLIRLAIFRRLYGKGPGPDAAYAAAIAVVILLILFHAFRSYRSIVLNSSIGLELYKLDRLSAYSALVILSTSSLLLCIPMLLQLLSPVVRTRTGLRYDALSRPARTLFSILAALLLVSTAAFLGRTKEENTIKIWATRLAMDRDITLEIQLRQVEEAIARDPVITSLSALNNSAGIILNRITENYLARISQSNDITVTVVPADDNSPGLRAFIQDRITGGTSISLRFFYSRNAGGQPRYTGNFYYYNARFGGRRVFIGVEPKSNREDRGYASLLGYSAPGQVLLPNRYTYAKYVEGRLVSFKGNFPYPTVFSSDISDHGFTHFINDITDEETIIITRARINAYNYLIAGAFLMLLVYLMTYPLTWMRRRKERLFERNYYKSRINAVLLGSLVITLVVMAVISVTFVYRRNNDNLRTLMSDKINSIQSLVQMRCRFVKSPSELATQEIAGILDDAGSVMKTDITLYTTGGKLFRSTTPEIFDQLLLGSRIDGEAWRGIVQGSQRYWIHRERFGKTQCYFLYAPIFNAAGEMIAILGAPYTDESYDFEAAAIIHAVSIITLFFLLLILARYITARVVDKMFRPIIGMGRKMNETDINNPEYIIYERDDEISSLVHAYNHMVHDLYDSTRQLTQAERDKAWATMARQVAHEIKNPLTPIKLQIQRLMRLKQNGNPAWVEKFDDVSKEVLTQIDILADTAGEFSTFAKLYTEESVAIDLDRLLQEQIGLFDSREDIELQYMGLSGAMVSGPKPQLTRVFVNLISNAIQAVESALEEHSLEKGHVLVSLRNSSREGFFDIVIEDDGPGVDEQNRSRLFTPNFTTKSKGTGLGLAISRSILEKCNAEIFYSRSFTLGGACFTVRYPKS